MLFLLLTIFVSVGIFLVFKIAGKSGLNPLPIVSINYFIAIGAGLFLTPVDFAAYSKFSVYFYLFAIVVGVLFMLLFLVLHRSINISGLGVTSVASKLAVAFPVLVSMFFDKNDHLYIKKLLGIAILLVAFSLIVLPKKQSLATKRDLIYPVLLLLGMGLVDSLIKTAQQFFIPSDATSNFSLLVFTVSAITGSTTLFIKRQVRQVLPLKTIILGALLGFCNYGSLYFMIKALNLNLQEANFLDSSRIFIINSLGIILITTLIGRIFFKEPVALVNIIGLIIALFGFLLIV